MKKIFLLLVLLPVYAWGSAVEQDPAALEWQKQQQQADKRLFKQIKAEVSAGYTDSLSELAALYYFGRGTKKAPASRRGHCEMPTGIGFHDSTLGLNRATSCQFRSSICPTVRRRHLVLLGYFFRDFLSYLSPMILAAFTVTIFFDPAFAELAIALTLWLLSRPGQSGIVFAADTIVQASSFSRQASCRDITRASIRQA